jgi:NAD(P)-dependent dehydrogenase (short-subunit alcohol dehydrogenase family)
MSLLLIVAVNIFADEPHVLLASLQVLNAGVGMHNFFHKTDDLSVYRRLMEINFYGYLYCTKFAFEHLKKAKGNIVVVSSVSGMC